LHHFDLLAAAGNQESEQEEWGFLFFFDTIKLIPYIASGSSKSRANKDVT
jgi:hypothetical protein